MIKHLFKLVWNRKRTNILIGVEIFFSFLVLFSIAAFGVYYADNQRRPMGFSHENVWVAQLGYQTPPGSPEVPATLRQIYLMLQDCDEVASAAGATWTLVPYAGAMATYQIEYKGRKIVTQKGEGMDGLKEVLNLKLVHGRWFEKGDDAMKWSPVIINQRFCRELFGAEDPLGKKIYSNWQVVGVISDLRRSGEFEELDNITIERINLNRPSLAAGALPPGATASDRPSPESTRTRSRSASSPRPSAASQRDYHPLPSHFLIKVRPGTKAAFGEKLMAKLQAVAPGWTFRLETLSQVRRAYFKQRLAPLIAVGLIATFLIMMVGLGLMGVLWQNVTQRTKEIGLRRANGATAEHIYKQILGELLVITTFGVAAGTLIIIQFPLLKLFSFLSAQVYIISLAISVALMYLLTILCGLYPARLATKVHPAEALHYE